MSKRESKYNFGTGLASIFILNIILWTIVNILLFTEPNDEQMLRALIYIQISFGFLQYIYVIPLMLWQMVKQKMQLAYGMFIGSLPALLINIGFIVWIAILFKDGVGL